MQEENKTINSEASRAVVLNRLVRLPKRIWYGIKIGWWAFRHPDPLGEKMFIMLSDLLQLILKVSFEDKHYMTEIVITNPDTKALQPIVYIWAGAGINAEPLKRIQELVEENRALKDRLRST